MTNILSSIQLIVYDTDSDTDRVMSIAMLFVYDTDWAMPIAMLFVYKPG
jgi:hypothetical protein